jgi:hypothetical protein
MASAIKPTTSPAMIDSTGNPGIIPPGVVFRTTVNTWPVLATVSDWAAEIPLLLTLAEYVPGGRVKATNPCASVTPWSGVDRHGVKAAEVATTLTPASGSLCASTTLTVMVTFCAQTGVVVVENVVVLAVVKVDTVETTMDVEVVANTPPNGENLSIVERGVL